jgi:hypothetical protein
MRTVAFAVVVISLSTVAPAARAQFSIDELAALHPELSGAIPTSSPVSLTDGRGQLWDIQYDGTVGDGTADTFDGAATIEVDGSYGSYGGMQLLLEDGRTVAIPTTAIGRLMITRMVYVSPDDGYARWVDVLDNPANESTTARVTYTFAMGSDDTTTLVTTTSGDAVMDSGDRGWVSDDASEIGDDPAFGLIYGDEGTDAAPTAQFFAGNDMPTVSFSVDIPANGSAALALLMTQRTSRAEAVQWLESTDPRALMGDVSAPVVNFSGVGGGMSFRVAGLLRGSERDVVELRNGDRLEGTVTDKSWTVETAHGSIPVKLKDVAGLVAGEPGWGNDQVVLLRGEILVGHLSAEPVTLQLPLGRKLSLPRESIARIGMRHRSEAEESYTPTDDTAMLVRGDQLQGKILTQSFGVATPYGAVALDLGRVAGIDFRAEGDRLHRVRLADGSTITGIITEPMVVFRHHGGQELDMALSGLVALEVPGLLIEPSIDPDAPVFTLANGDTWYARPVTETLPFRSTVGSFDLRMEEIHSLRILDAATGEAVVQLADGGTLSGRLTTTALILQLVCGLQVTLPLDQLRDIKVPGERAAEATGGNLGLLPLRLGG